MDARKASPHAGTLLVLLWAVLSAACAALPAGESVPSALLPADRSHGLGRIAADSAPQGSAFRALPAAAQALDARLALIQRAQHSIDLQTYQLHDDDAGRQVARALRDAAGRGARVRLLVDDLYSAENRTLLLELAAHRNVEVRLFNPFAAGRSLVLARYLVSLFDFARVNHRMHNKLLLVDGAFAIAGGRNIGDPYFRRGKDGNFVDFDLLLVGDVVPDLAAIFDRYWNSPHVRALHALESPDASDDVLHRRFEQRTRLDDDAPDAAPRDTGALRHSLLSRDLDRPPLALLRGRVEALADDPDKVTGRIAPERSVTAWFVGAVDHARSRVTLVSPYFLPGERGLDVLRRARERGVQVELVTNTVAANDEPLVAAAYARYRKALLRMGVTIHEVGSGQLKTVRLFRDALGASTGRSHAKLTVIDGERVFVGSMNMDPRSARENTELGLLVDSAELAIEVQQLLDLLRSGATYRLRLDSSGEHVQWVAVDGGRETVHHDDPELPVRTRLKLDLLSPFIPEGLL
jgi:cardiolipin synthase C